MMRSNLPTGSNTAFSPKGDAFVITRRILREQGTDLPVLEAKE